MSLPNYKELILMWDFETTEQRLESNVDTKFHTELKTPCFPLNASIYKLKSISTLPHTNTDTIQSAMADVSSL